MAAERADVVVVGGGVVGCAVAAALAQAGVDVLLLERGQLGSGSSSKAAGGVRACFSDPINIALGLRSLDLLREVDAATGGGLDLHRVGYLFALTTDALVAEYGAAVDVQRSMGMRSRLVDPDEARGLSPLFRWDDVLAACWSPDDGTCTPEAVVAAYAARARAAGARLVTGVEVTGIEVDGGTVRSVLVRGRDGAAVVGTGAVVCAAGAWSRQVGAWVGVDLPVTPYRREIVVTGPVAGLPADVPMTIDAATSLYLHREGNGLLAGFSDDRVEAGFGLDRDPAYVERLAELAAHRAPVLLDAGVASGWAGLYEVTPDHNAVVGVAPSVSRFLYATGFSGHGFLQGPAVGEVVRDLLLDREPLIDVTPLSAERFAAGTDRPERHIV